MNADFVVSAPSRTIIRIKITKKKEANEDRLQLHGYQGNHTNYPG